MVQALFPPWALTLLVVLSICVDWSLQLTNVARLHPLSQVSPSRLSRFLISSSNESISPMLSCQNVFYGNETNFGTVNLLLFQEVDTGNYSIFLNQTHEVSLGCFSRPSQVSLVSKENHYQVALLSDVVHSTNGQSMLHLYTLLDERSKGAIKLRLESSRIFAKDYLIGRRTIRLLPHNNPTTLQLVFIGTKLDGDRNQVSMDLVFQSMDSVGFKEKQRSVLFTHEIPQSSILYQTGEYMNVVWREQNIPYLSVEYSHGLKKYLILSTIGFWENGAVAQPNNNVKLLQELTLSICDDQLHCSSTILDGRGLVGSVAVSKGNEIVVAYFRIAELQDIPSLDLLQVVLSWCSIQAVCSSYVVDYVALEFNNVDSINPPRTFNVQEPQVAFRRDGKLILQYSIGQTSVFGECTRSTCTYKFQYPTKKVEQTSEIVNYGAHRIENLGIHLENDTHLYLGMSHPFLGVSFQNTAEHEQHFQWTGTECISNEVLTPCTKQAPNHTKYIILGVVLLLLAIGLILVSVPTVIILVVFHRGNNPRNKYESNSNQPFPL